MQRSFPQVLDIRFNLENIPVTDPEVAQNMMGAFSMDEIKTVVFGMALNKSAGPNGFPIEFYQKF
jgi:hypothetical protein